ncbi:MAG: rhodanese-like domain-containing protein [Pseudomonadota bacterium]
MKFKTTLAALGAVSTLCFAGLVSAEGNRYELPRYYASEVSVSEAYLAMEHSKDYRHHRRTPKPVIVDVRTLREYASGHPEDAYNVPFPNVTGFSPEVAQDPAKLYWEVYDIVRGRMDTPIMLLCRTGQRSVLAGNILANPDSNPATAGLQPFTNVRNIWEGFVGQPRYAFAGSKILLDTATDQDGNTLLIGGPYVLDLNNDDVINADTADVYTQTKDANPDKDGWRNFAKLPWTTRIVRDQAYERDVRQYKALNLTPVQ